MNLGLVGATGQVGRVMRDILEQRRFPATNIRFFASERSKGRVLDFADRQVEVEDAASADFRGLDIVLFSAGATTSQWLAPRVASAGAVVIDNSSAWRMDPEVPLVVPEVNGVELKSIPKGIVANPNCTTMIVMSPLRALSVRWGLRKVVASTYQAVSGAGGAGVAELIDELRVMDGATQELPFSSVSMRDIVPSVFPEVIAGNVVPLAGSWVGDETSEEQKFRNESRKILSLPNLAVSVTCVRVPVFTGHSVALTVDLSSSFDLAEVRTALESAPGMCAAAVPTPLGAVGRDDSLIGRVRRDECFEFGLSFFVSGDNLRKGAALNAIQIAESLLGVPSV